METSMFAVKFLQVWVFQLNINTHMLLILELQPVRRNDVLFKGKKIRNSPCQTPCLMVLNASCQERII